MPRSSTSFAELRSVFFRERSTMTNVMAAVKIKVEIMPYPVVMLRNSLRKNPASHSPANTAAMNPAGIRETTNEQQNKMTSFSSLERRENFTFSSFHLVTMRSPHFLNQMPYYRHQVNRSNQFRFLRHPAPEAECFLLSCRRENQ